MEERNDLPLPTHCPCGLLFFVFKLLEVIATTADRSIPMQGISGSLSPKTIVTVVVTAVPVFAFVNAIEAAKINLYGAAVFSFPFSFFPYTQQLFGTSAGEGGQIPKSSAKGA